MGHQVFISYSSIDAANAQRACAALESAGIQCWMAPRDVAPGTDYPAAIVDAVASATLVVLLLTEHALASPHIVTEVEHAFTDRKAIVPFRCGTCALSKDLDYFLATAQRLEAQEGCTADNLRRLVAAVQSALRGERLAELGPHRVSAVNPKVLGLVVLVLLGIVGAYWKWPGPSQGATVLTDNTKDTSGKVDGIPKADYTAKADLVGKVATPDHEPKSWRNPEDGQIYVWIPAGTYTMGCSAGDSECADDEKPAHPVDISKGFWLARTETTIEAFRRIAPRLKVEAPVGDPSLPAADVTWSEAKAYCAAVGGRLPSEAGGNMRPEAGRGAHIMER